MGRPCTCEKPGCRLCRLAATDPRYRRAWGLEQPMERVPACSDAPGDQGRQYTQINEPPEAERRKAMCRDCGERPEGCWRNQTTAVKPNSGRPSGMRRTLGDARWRSGSR